MVLRFPAKKALVPVLASAVLCFGATVTAVGSSGKTSVPKVKPKWSKAVAFDVSAPLREMATSGRVNKPVASERKEIREERVVRAVRDRGHSPPMALCRAPGRPSAQPGHLPSPSLTFEGLSNQDNFNVFGFRVNPPDPVGDVGPNHYVEMVNLVFAVYYKTGNLLLGPVDTGTLWADFAIDDCTDPSGDPIVSTTSSTDRWILSQFTTRGLVRPGPVLQLRRHLARPAIRPAPTTATRSSRSRTRDGGTSSPTTRSTASGRTRTSSPRATSGSLTIEYGISVYALEKNKMVKRRPERPRGAVLPRLERRAARR